MKNTKWIVALAIIVLLVKFSAAQQQEWCGTVENIKQMVANNPGLAADYEKFKNEMKNLELKAASRSTQDNNELVFIPVIFHVVHNGDAYGTGENIKDEQVLSAIDALNRDYNNNGWNMDMIPEPFRPLVANCHVKFCPAQFDPQGLPTNGVIRHQFPRASWNTMNEIDSVLKPATIWDRNVYLNVWSVNMGGTLLSQNLLGYSSLPFPTTPEQSDGVTVRYNVLGTTGNLAAGYNNGKTLAHEVGHWFGLFHIWGDDLGLCMGDGAGGSDFIDDTPDAADANFGCPTFPHITCNNGPNGDMFVNFMDYSNDECGTMFTPQQADRMHAMLNGFRSPIKIALTACFYDLDADIKELIIPGDTLCSLSFQPTITFRNGGVADLNSGKFYYQMDGGSTQEFDWNGPPLVTGDEVRLLLPEQNVSTGTHTFSVTFSNPNGNGIDNNSFNDSRTDTFYAYDGGPSAAVPFTQDFEAAFPSANWHVENPNNDIVTWEQSDSVGGYGQSSKSMVMNNKAYTLNPNKKRDAIVSDNYDFSAISRPELNFDVAYARLNGNRSDSLLISYSIDCGSTWKKLWSANGTKLATSPDMIPLFVPTASQWKTIHVPLWTFAYLKKVSLKFENISGWGNALYIDNINVKNNPLIGIPEVKKEKEKEEIKVFPNPASSMVAVRLPFGHGFKQLQLINSVGQVVYTTRITDTAIIVPVEGFAAGLYLVNLTGDKAEQTEKILIGR